MNKVGSLESQLMDAFKEKEEKEVATTAVDAQKLQDKENVVIYDKDNPNDLIDKINYYLNNRDVLQRIAKNGFDNLLKYHTSEVRAKEFIETCERYMSEN